jgi:hypothetical protein
MSTLSLRLPNSLHKAAKMLAKKEHVSVNQLITLAIAEKLSALETADYLSKRAKQGKRTAYLDILKNAPDIIPDDEDEF